MIFIIKRWRGRTILPEETNLSQQWMERLQQSGYRITGSRRAVVEVMAASPFILNPMEIFQQAARRYPGLGLVTVYRTLDKLEELGLVQRVHLEGGCHSYIAAGSGHQHLLICTSCNRAVYFSGDDFDPLMAEVGGGLGFTIQDHWLQLFGTCKNCQSEAEKGGNKH